MRRADIPYTASGGDRNASPDVFAGLEACYGDQAAVRTNRHPDSRRAPYGNASSNDSTEYTDPRLVVRDAFLH